jgi:hypothetical protein
MESLSISRICRCLLDGKKSRGSGTRLKGGLLKLKKERYKKEES